MQFAQVLDIRLVKYLKSILDTFLSYILSIYVIITKPTNYAYLITSIAEKYCSKKNNHGKRSCLNDKNSEHLKISSL